VLALILGFKFLSAKAMLVLGLVGAAVWFIARRPARRLPVLR
jgi:hypothetical protein